MIRYHKQAEKFVLSQDRKTAVRLTEAIRQLPLGDVKPLQGSKNPKKFRLRVGGFKVVFCFEQNVITILRIDNRGDIYK